MGSNVLPKIISGQHVFIQNQKAAGNMAKRWDKTGVVLEVLGFDKYSVKVDVSGRVTDRNRCYLRNFKPAVESPLLRGPRPDVCVLRALVGPAAPVERRAPPPVESRAFPPSPAIKREERLAETANVASLLLET